METSPTFEKTNDTMHIDEGSVDFSPLSNIKRAKSIAIGTRYAWKSSKIFSPKSLFWEGILRVVMVILISLLEFTPAFDRIIQVPDMHQYAYPYKTSLSYMWMTVSTILLGYLVFIPACKIYESHHRTSARNIGVLNAQDTIPKSFFWTELIAFTLALSMACLSTSLFTNIIKSMYGEPRPDYFNRCFPTKYNDSIDNQGLPYTPDKIFFECEPRDTFVDSQILIDGRKSFPSGHSSMICTLAYVIVWYCMERAFPEVSLYHEPTMSMPGLKLFGYLAGSIPVLFVLIGRTRDYRHHWSDVIAGALTGLFLGSISVSLYFHSRLSRNKLLQLSS